MSTTYTDAKFELSFWQGKFDGTVDKMRVASLDYADTPTLVGLARDILDNHAKVVYWQNILEDEQKVVSNN